MSNKRNDLLNNKLSSIMNQNDHQKRKTQEEVRNQLTDQKDSTPDFTKIAEELQKRHEEEKHSLNDNHVKMTIYVEENIAKAFMALCVKRGDQKKYLNEALAQYIQQKYREINRNKS